TYQVIVNGDDVRCVFADRGITGAAADIRMPDRPRPPVPGFSDVIPGLTELVIVRTHEGMRRRVLHTRRGQVGRLPRIHRITKSGHSQRTNPRALSELIGAGRTRPRIDRGVIVAGFLYPDSVHERIEGSHIMTPKWSR